MGSYHQFPKCSPAAEAARQRDEKWRDEQLRCAMRLPPRPVERVDTTPIVERPPYRFGGSELQVNAPHPTLH